MKQLLGLIAWLVVSLAAGLVGSRFMPGPWYEALSKPSWTPPNAVFGPVWTTLYILMGVAAWLVWRKAGFPGARVALGLFLLQLVLNALWSYLFFGLQRLDLGLVEIVALWVVIVATLIQFWRVSVTAGLLLVPYLLWVSFATAITFELWRRNG